MTMTPELWDRLFEVIATIILFIASFILPKIHAWVDVKIAAGKAQLDSITDSNLRSAAYVAVNAVEQMAYTAAKKWTSEEKLQEAVSIIEAKGFQNVQVADIESVVKQLKEKWAKL